MVKFQRVIAVLVISLTAGAEQAPETAVAEIVNAATISVKAWARATPPGSTTGAIYGEFSNTGDTDRTVNRIEFDRAHHVMVHRTSHSGGMARMQAGQLQIPAAGAVSLAPGGMHIMVMGLSEPLVGGCEYSFRLFWDDGSVTQHSFATGGFGQMQAPAPKSGDVAGECQ